MPIIHTLKINKMVKIAVFDLDGTLDKGDSFLFFLIHVLIKSPKKWLFLFNLLWGLFLFLSNKEFNRTDLKSLFLRNIIKNQNKEFIEREAKLFVQKRFKKSLNNNVLEIINSYRKKNYYLILATGSLDVYVKFYSKNLGFDKYICTELEISKKVYSGKLKKGNCIGMNKFFEVRKFVLNKKKSLNDVIFFSDHHSDFPLFKSCGELYAVRPKYKLIKKLKKNKIKFSIIN